MINDPFLSQANKIIGDNARFVKNFQAEPYTPSPTSSPAAPAANPMEMMMTYLNPMMMMMMFRMMDAIITKMEGGTSQSPFQQASTPFIPGVTAPAAGTGTGVASTTQTTPSIADNPAVSYLENMLLKKLGADPQSTSITFSADEITSVKSAISTGALSMTQVGQALKYALDTAPESTLPAISQLIAELGDSGDLNLAPFLQNDYLAKLTDVRKDVLMQAITQAGLTLADGTPNARFVGFILDSLAKDGDEQTKAFLQTYLQATYSDTSIGETSPERKILESILSLSGTTVDAQNQLVFLKPVQITSTATSTTTPTPSTSTGSSADSTSTQSAGTVNSSVDSTLTQTVSPVEPVSSAADIVESEAGSTVASTAESTSSTQASTTTNPLNSSQTSSVNGFLDSIVTSIQEAFQKSQTP